MIHWRPPALEGAPGLAWPCHCLETCKALLPGLGPKASGVTYLQDEPAWPLLPWPSIPTPSGFPEAMSLKAHLPLSPLLQSTPGNQQRVSWLSLPGLLAFDAARKVSGLR